MKYITHSWDKEYDGVLFFVQRMEEMLFHYSDDIVRVPIHNTVTLVREYIQVEGDSNISRYNLRIIAEELINSLEHDVVLKEYYGNAKIERLIKSIKSNERNTICYIASTFPFSTYNAWCSTYLVKHLKQANHKVEISKGLRLWLSSIMWVGYTPEYIYRYLKSSFEKEISDPLEAVTDFITHFHFEEHEYRVYFIFQESAVQYKELFNSRLGINFDDDGFFDNITLYNNRFIGYTDIQAIDPYSARDIGIGALNIFADFYKVLSNRTKPIISKNVMVRNTITNEVLRIPIAATGYKAIESPPHEDLQKAIDSAILACQQKPAHTYRSLKKMIGLHNTAIQQSDLEDGFVNLWSIMEVVSNSSENGSTIDGVIQSVLPILQNDYYLKYFRLLNDDLKKALSKEQYRHIVAIEDDKPLLEKIMCFVFLPEYEQLRETVFEELSEYPNIRDKIYQLYLLKDNRTKVYALSSNYAQRVSWHLYRLYRLRNKIVHAGETDRNIQLLGEHLHIYCDSILYELITKLATEKSFLSIGDVLVDGQLLGTAKKDYFKEHTSISRQDISMIYTLFFNGIDSCIQKDE